MASVKRQHSTRDLFPAELCRAMDADCPGSLAFCLREARKSALSSGLPDDEAAAVEYWRQRLVQAGVPVAFGGAR